MKSAKLIIDLQFGSTGKGLIAGYLAKRDNPDTLITAWAANAGHSYIDSNGRIFIHTMLANGVVSDNLKQIIIGPGSLINPDSLIKELTSVEDLLIGRDVKIIIHPHAAVISQKHVDEEQGPMTKIGSTKKGVGAAMIDRIRRDPEHNNVACNVLHDHPILSRFIATVSEYNAAMDRAEIVQIEGAQGYSLSMYHGMYPYTTSRDVTPAQIFADCGIPMSWWPNTEVIGTMRTFPIRVANRFDDKGQQVGYSGNCYPDQQELRWEDLGISPELTTVTRLPRRIFTLSQIQLEEAIRQCSVDSIFLNFVNYCRDEAELADMMAMVTQAIIKGDVLAGICYMGFGPNDGDVLEMTESTSILEIVERWKNTAHYPVWVKDRQNKYQEAVNRQSVIGIND
mgnify:CR=1 FL=1